MADSAIDPRSAIMLRRRRELIVEAGGAAGEVSPAMLAPALRELLGADVEHTPMYPAPPRRIA